jgi:hypothetical protein
MKDRRLGHLPRLAYSIGRLSWARRQQQHRVVRAIRVRPKIAGDIGTG